MAQIEWSPNSIRRLRAIHAYIARQSPMNAERWFLKVTRSVIDLKRLPEIGSPVEDYEYPGLRERIVGNYRIIYTYDGTTCLIVTILRAEQDITRTISPDDFL